MSSLEHLRKQVPNILSASRIIAALAFPFIPVSWRFPMIMWALLSEFLDGFLARKCNAITSLGQLLDPIGDKLFILATIGVLILEHQLSWLDFVLIAMRDIVVACGSISILMEAGSQSISFLMPRMSGKITTAFQFALLTSFYGFPALVPYLFVTTIVVSCLSAIDYLYAALHRRFDRVM